MEKLNLQIAGPDVKYHNRPVHEAGDALLKTKKVKVISQPKTKVPQAVLQKM